jgi:hypothetical protein
MTKAAHCLVGYIHLDKVHYFTSQKKYQIVVYVTTNYNFLLLSQKQLDQMEVSVGSIIKRCQEAIVKQVKKNGKMRQIMKRSNIILRCFILPSL